MNKLIKKLPYWDSLTDLEKNAVKNTACVYHYEKGSTLYGNGNDGFNCLGMIHVLSGDVRVYFLSDDGREITLFRLRAGDSYVLSASCVIMQIDFDTIISATTDAEVLIVPAALFVKLPQENIHVRCFMYELMTEHYSTAMWVIQQILLNRFDQRLAAFFLKEYQRTGSPEIRMTQEQIAQNINSAREVVARMLKQFALEGFIDNHRGIIKLKDIKGLEKIL